MHLSHIDDAEPFRSSGGSSIRELAGLVSLPARKQSDERLVRLCCCAPPWTAADTILTGG